VEWTEERTQHMLKKFDKDGDGRWGALSNPNPNLNRDPNVDGRISDAEFVLGFSNSLPYDEDNMTLTLNLTDDSEPNR